MRGIIIDKNFSEAFVCLEDGETISIPSSEVTDSNVGEMITLSNISIPTNYNSNTNLTNEKLLDFF